MAAVAVKNNEETLDRYKGETKNQMRHGETISKFYYNYYHIL